MTLATHPASVEADAAQIVLNTIRRPVIMIGPEGNITFANADAEDFFRSSAAGLTRKTLAHFVPFGSPILARRAEEAGVRMVTIHGRTRCQFYKGKADWRSIARGKAAVTIPVVANGDVGSAIDVRAVLEQSGADAVMVGRASYGAPWIAGQIAGAALGDTSGNAPTDGAALADYVVAHYEDMLTLYGAESGLRQARKHLGWYLDRHVAGLPSELRSRILTSLDPADVVRALRTAFMVAGEFELVRTAA